MKLFEKFFCPHCNAPLNFSNGYLPNQYPICCGIIWYTKYGRPIKGWFKCPEMPISVNDIAAIILLIVALIWAYNLKFK
jgi:hypothetical protein